MPAGPSPAERLAAESLPRAITECMESLMQEVNKELSDDDSDSSCAFLASCHSDSETDLGPEPGDSSPEETTSEGRIAQSGKRQRLLGAKDCSRSEQSCARQAAQAAAAEVNMIILDWDDTICPSTWLNQSGLTIAADSPLPNDEQKAQLRRIGQCAIKFLRRAKHLGHVIIVTNAEKGWVELSCCKFLPEVFPHLEGVKVLSARSTFEPSTVVSAMSPILWKRQAFDLEIDAFLKTRAMYSEPGRQKSMISIGDSMQERTALLEATADRECFTKSLKLLERPTPEQLARQHEVLRSCLRQFVDYEGSLDLCLGT